MGCQGNTLEYKHLRNQTVTMKATIYHNPRCTKSRETLQLLEQHGMNPEVVEYLKDPPDRATLEKLLDMLGIEPRALLRTKEDEYQAAGLDNPSLGREAIIDAMIKYPRLIERPIVVIDGRAAIGRPPQKILELL